MLSRCIHMIFLAIVVFYAGCNKEYSCESCDSVVNPDNTITNIPKPYICPSCIAADDFVENKWSLSNGNNFYCGVIDTAIAAPARNGFTFFGPSACSADSGLVMTISTEPAFLNQDVFNSTSTKVGMYYYDNIGQTYPFITQPGLQFSITIESYIHQTRMMTGTFNGIVVRPNGGQTNVQGKFKVKVF